MLHRLCHCSELAEGEAKGFSANGIDLILVNSGGNFAAFVNRCPHRRIPLEWSPNQFICPETHLLKCSTHGALFLLDTGECVSGPCSGESLSKLALRLDDKGEIALVS